MIEPGDKVEVTLHGVVEAVDIGIPEQPMVIVKFSPVLPVAVPPSTLGTMRVYIPVDQAMKVTDV